MPLGKFKQKFRYGSLKSNIEIPKGRLPNCILSNLQMLFICFTTIIAFSEGGTDFIQGRIGKILLSRGGSEPIFSKYYYGFLQKNNLVPKFRGGSMLRSSPIPPSLIAFIFKTSEYNVDCDYNRSLVFTDMVL